MLSAIFISLIIPATEIGEIVPILIGLGLGGFFILAGDRIVGRFGIHSYSPTQLHS